MAAKHEFIKKLIKQISQDDDTKREERILSSLSCGGRSYTVGGPSYGALSRSDLNMCLSVLKEKQKTLMYAKYQDCLEYRNKLAYYVRMSMKINCQKKMHTEQIVNYLLDDILDPQKCRTCKGVGELVIDKKPITCPACKGSPNITTSQYKLGQAIGVSQQAWSKTYHKPYMLVIDHFLEVERVSIDKMVKRLYN